MTMWNESIDRATALWVALVLFGVYLLSFSGRIISSDGLSMFAVTESFVKRGDVATDQMWTFFGTKSAPAPDGEVYSKYGYGTSLFAAPFYALALALPFLGLMQATLVSSALAMAVTGALVYLAARRMRFSPTVAVIIALLFGLATPAWVYAKEFWSEAFAALTLFAAFYFLLCYREAWKPRDALLAGILLGLALAVRTTNVLLVPLYAGYAFLPRGFWARSFLARRFLARALPRTGQTAPEQIQWRAVGAFLVPVAIFLASILFYNWFRFQNPFATGYRADEDFSNNILLGAYGLLFSPGKGLFVFAPFFAALPFGVWKFYREQRRDLVFIAILFAVYVQLFAAWYYWWGGTNWGARFLVPILPFLVLLCAPLVSLVLETKTGLALYVLRIIFALVIVTSIVNELAGVAVNALTYRLRAVNLSPNPDWDSIFSPALSPLIGHWQALKTTNLDVGWMRATPEGVEIDWLVVGLTLALILFCAWRLRSSIRDGGRRTEDEGRLIPSPKTRGMVALALVAAVLLTLFSLARYADDPRLGGNEGYAELLQTLGTTARANDLLVLQDDAQARFFLNANRAPLKWYGLSRDPARWDESTQKVIAEQVTQHERVWFAFDDSVDAPNPMREWFATKLVETERFDFENGVSLVLYAAR